MLLRAWVIAGVLGVAPIQCASRRGPELAREDTPGDALWGLAERFGREGNTAARQQTLRYLVERYPSSRWATPAREALGP